MCDKGLKDETQSSDRGICSTPSTGQTPFVLTTLLDRMTALFLFNKKWQTEKSCDHPVSVPRTPFVLLAVIMIVRSRASGISLPVFKFPLLLGKCLTSKGNQSFAIWELPFWDISFKLFIEEQKTQRESSSLALPA